MKKMFKELGKFKLMLFVLLRIVIGSVIANLALPAYLSGIINTAIPN